jgi:hypothetical protein
MQVDWISVKERLPEAWQEVLCYDSFHEWFYFVEYYSKNRRGELVQYWMNDNGENLQSVTHWSTLPNRPPKSEGRWPNNDEWPAESYPIG